MNLFDDIKSPFLLQVKGGLFALLAAMTAVMIVLSDKGWHKIALLAVCLWAACRCYYFFFYVLDHYAGGDKNASLFAMMLKLFRRRKHAEIPTPQAPRSLVTNILADLPQNLPEERTETIAASKHIRIERIVSTGQSSPPGFWYDQDEFEWVVVLRGEAALEFEDRADNLSVGDCVLIPPHEKHRVASTSACEPTIWLAVFFRGTACHEC